MTVVINKFQMPTMTFQPIPLIGVPSIYENIVFSETNRPIELNFYMKTPYNKLAKINTKCSGHMTKMVDIPIYGKNHKNLFQNQKANDLGTWYVALGMWGLPSFFFK